MISCSTISELNIQLNKSRAAGRIGFVPTMGALHDGHISLVRKSLADGNTTVCSIFVNPTQFNDPKDLEKYPRTVEADSKMIAGAGCHFAYIPSVKEIYPTMDLLKIDLGNLDKVMEGDFRPGHFNGVVTVVHKLFDLVKPGAAYFGEKDFQQLAVIRFMVNYFKLPVKIIACPTVREADGLAMSSRNVRLTVEERKESPVIFHALTEAAKKANEKKHSVAQLQQQAIKQIEQSNLFKVEYFEFVNAQTLQPVTEIKTEPVRICTAVKTSTVRLIDNVAV